MVIWFLCKKKKRIANLINMRKLSPLKLKDSTSHDWQKKSEMIINDILLQSYMNDL